MGRSRRCQSGVALGGAFLMLLAAAAPALEVPFLTGRVNDHPELIPEETERSIEDKLRSFEEESGAQITVLTIESLEGDVLEEFSLRVAETWGLGRKGIDDGVLLLVAKNDRKMRIEVGYGLEERLTDLQSGRILNHILRPFFRRGEFGAGIEQGVDAILGTLRGAEVIPVEPPGGASDVSAPPMPLRIGLGLFLLLFFIPFIAAALFSKGLSSWFLYFFLMPFFGVFPSVFVHPKAGLIILGTWIVAFPILKFWLRKSPAGRRLVTSHPGWTTWASSGGRSGGGWSGGAFSGGGGSFGGGGASGSW